MSLLPNSLCSSDCLTELSRFPCLRHILLFCLEDEKDIQDIHSIGHSFFSVLCPHWRPEAIGHGCMHYGSLVAFNASGKRQDELWDCIATTVATALDQEKEGKQSIGDLWVPLSDIAWTTESKAMLQSCKLLNSSLRDNLEKTKRRLPRIVIPWVQ